MKKNAYNNIKFLLIIIQQFLILFFILFKNKSGLVKNLNYEQNINKTSMINKKINLDYENNIFSILRINCPTCGLFSYFKQYISCIIKNIIMGYIPIIDLVSTNNIFNSFKANSSNINPWEYFFEQPLGYTLQNVLKKSKNIKIFVCSIDQSMPIPHYNGFFNYYYKIDFWHYIANKYIPINKIIIKETNFIRQKLFKDNNNILGVLARGTDFIILKPKGHPIAPDYKIIIKDIKKMDDKNKYDYIFLTTEDDNIRAKIVKEFGQKIKCLIYKKAIKYNYSKKDDNNYLAFNENIKGNLEFMKIYLINIIILSNCLDIIAARTNGSIGAFIFSNGFRYAKVYFLGNY